MIQSKSHHLSHMVEAALWHGYVFIDDMTAHRGSRIGQVYTPCSDLAQCCNTDQTVLCRADG